MIYHLKSYLISRCWLGNMLDTIVEVWETKGLKKNTKYIHFSVPPTKAILYI